MVTPLATRRWTTYRLTGMTRAPSSARSRSAPHTSPIRSPRRNTRLIFVADIERREEVWRAGREVFSGDFPVATLVEVGALAAPKLLVEVEAIAALGAGGT